MRILFLTSNLEATDGWGTYSSGFVAQARRFHGENGVICPDPKTLRSVGTGRLRAAWLFIDALRLLKVAKTCDIIHALVEWSAPTAWLLSKLTGRPYLISTHGTYADIGAYPSRLRWLYRLAFRGARNVIAVSHYTARVAKRSFGDDLPVEVIPGGFTPGQTSNVKRQMSGDSPRLLTVGALKPRKGFHTLVEALAQLRASAWQADFVGSQDLEAYVSRLKEMVVKLDIADRITFKGRVAPAELANLYARADLFVMPSEHVGTEFEGLGLVYLEALSRGVPVIGCRESGAEDVIKDGVNGRLVPPGDPAALAAAIKVILTDEAGRKRMSEAAPDSIRDFAWDKVGADMDALYRKIEHGAGV